MTQELLRLSKNRRLLVADIQKIKVMQSDNVWDPKQEVFLFEGFESELKDFSLQEALWFSLMIEMQSGHTGSYPEWSSCVHLAQKNHSIIDQVNPILLRMCYPKEYAKLQLTDFYQKQVLECLKDHE